MKNRVSHTELEDAMRIIKWNIDEGLIDEATVEDMSDEELVHYAKTNIR